MPHPSLINCPLYFVPDITPCDPGEIAPLIAHLEADLPAHSAITFPRGTVLEDGRLDLCKQSLGPAGCRMVADALTRNTRVRSLLLGTDGIGDGGAGDVARLIEQNEHLEIVYLGCNKIGEDGVAALAETLAENRSVRGLWLKRNPVGPAGAIALAQMLRRNRMLRTLDLVNTYPGLDGLTELVDALLSENRTVERLYLGGNGIDAQGAVLLAKLLRANPALKALMLSVNDLGDAGAAILADALRENLTLEALGLASNNITSEGGAALFAAAQTHPALNHLDFSCAPSTRVLGAQRNNLGDSGAESAGAFLAENRALTHLNLCHNGVTEKGKRFLIAGLEQNTTLQELLLDGKQNPRVLALLQRNQPEGAPEHPVSEDIALIRSVYRTLHGS